MSISFFYWVIALAVAIAVVWSASVWSRKRRERELREQLGFPEFTVHEESPTPGQPEECRHDSRG